MLNNFDLSETYNRTSKQQKTIKDIIINYDIPGI